jgi:probable HAF family extracellular repeat protein
MSTTSLASLRVPSPCGRDSHPDRVQRGLPALRVAAFVLAALAGIAQASPRPPIYHVEAVQAEWHDAFLYSVNANGVAAGYWGSAVSQAAVWQDGVLRQLNCQNQNATYSHAYAINDAMQVAGSCSRSIGNYAVVWDAQGNPTPVRDGAIEADLALGINNSGQVVGTDGGVAYVWKAGKLKLLGTLGGSTSTPNDINDKGVIVGSSKLAGDTVDHAFVYRNGQMKDLNWPWAMSYARAVNARGHIVGWSGDTVYSAHAILDDGTTITDLGRHTSALGINRYDQVVGYRVNGNHAFIYTHGRVYDLNTRLDPTSDPDWEISVAYDINDAGVIVGWGILHGSYQPVVLTPLP